MSLENITSAPRVEWDADARLAMAQLANDVSADSSPANRPAFRERLRALLPLCRENGDRLALTMIAIALRWHDMVDELLRTFSVRPDQIYMIVRDAAAVDDGLTERVLKHFPPDRDMVQSALKAHSPALLRLLRDAGIKIVKRVKPSQHEEEKGFHLRLCVTMGVLVSEDKREHLELLLSDKAVAKRFGKNILTSIAMRGTPAQMDALYDLCGQPQLNWLSLLSLAEISNNAPMMQWIASREGVLSAAIRQDNRSLQKLANVMSVDSAFAHVETLNGFRTQVRWLLKVMQSHPAAAFAAWLAERPEFRDRLMAIPKLRQKRIMSSYESHRSPFIAGILLSLPPERVAGAVHKISHVKRLMELRQEDVQEIIPHLKSSVLAVAAVDELVG